MNMDKSPSIEQLGALLGDQDDAAGEHVLWVDVTGEVHIATADSAPADDAQDARLIYAPFEAGVGFVGEDAAADPELLTELLYQLQEHWASAKAAAPGVIRVDLDDPEAGAGWTMTAVATVDDALLASMGSAPLH